MGDQALPKYVAREDAKLERAASKTAEDLAAHRWHWTLDEDNPKRVSFRAYAREVGVQEKRIRQMVNGYVAWGAGAGARTLSEEIERAGMSVERQATTEAVAKAHGVSFKQARMTRGTEIGRTQQYARERAEKRGTTVAEEAEAIAQRSARLREKDARDKTSRKQKHALRFFEVEGHLAKALKSLTAALNASHGVPWTDEERQLLEDTIAKVRALLGLVDMGIAGQADVDWDAELDKITGAA